MRLLVSGARAWTDAEAVGLNLSTHFPERDIILVHGDAKGLDKIAAYWAQVFGWMTEPHPANRYATPRIRNAEMVRRGAKVCMTWALTWDSGTGMTARMARKAGIPVLDMGVGTDWKDR